jgi:hypothetical protein
MDYGNSIILKFHLLLVVEELQHVMDNSLHIVRTVQNNLDLSI